MPAKPKPALPNPAAVLPGEADILATVIADLSDDTAKLVYADWLQDRDDPRGPLLRKFVTAFRAAKKLPDTTTSSRPWRDLVGITLIEEARKKKLEASTESLLSLARPALRLELVQTIDKKIPIGISKFRGIPDMPADMEWPQWDSTASGHGLPAFAVQINLSDLERSVVARELPSAGVLSFWWGVNQLPTSHWACRVFHFLDTAELVRRKLPRGAYNNGQYDPCSITFTETLTLPEVANSSENYDPNLGDGVYEACGELHSEYFEHHLLGHARTIHFDVPAGKGERLLLQLAAGNVLNFTIRDDDLRQNRFDRVGFSFER